MIDNLLTCGQCNVRFEGTPSQRNHAKYRPGSNSYCSPICRKTAVALNLSKQFTKPIPQYGPCPTCGEMFHSRQPKKFCSQTCYVASDQFKEMMAKNASKGRQAGAVKYKKYRQKHSMSCKNCGEEFYVKPARQKAGQRFCGQLCYRKFMSARFDRWAANPETIALPQNFDEFLTKDILPCLVEGCDWVGHHLSLHMNQAHGVPARDFKRAAGFNLGSGVVSAPLQEAMCDRDNVGFNQFSDEQKANFINSGTRKGDEVIGRTYVSLEGREHRSKAAALAAKTPGKIRICGICQKSFRQLGNVRTRYCSKKCQRSGAAEMNARYAARVNPLTCSECGDGFNGTRQQQLRSDRGLDVVCSTFCRQRRNGRSRKRIGSGGQNP